MPIFFNFVVVVVVSVGNTVKNKSWSFFPASSGSVSLLAAVA